VSCQAGNVANRSYKSVEQAGEATLDLIVSNDTKLLDSWPF
jgi:hypothetical protein